MADNMMRVAGRDIINGTAKAISVDADGNINSKIKGNNFAYPYNVVATNIQAKITLPDNINRIVISNDGVVDAEINFNSPMDNESDRLTVNHTDLIATKSGAWSTIPNTLAFGASFAETIQTGAFLIIDPAEIVEEIGFWGILGPVGGISQLDLSLDGVNWFPPSQIGGVTRSDGVLGIAMDKLDQYSGGIGMGRVEDIRIFTVPKGMWKLKITVTGTKNPASSSYATWVDALIYKSTNESYFNLKGGEVETFNLIAQSIHYKSSEGIVPLRVRAYGE